MNIVSIKIIFYFFTMIILTYCDGVSHRNDLGNKDNRLKVINKSERDSVVKFVEEFYDWYLKERYNRKSSVPSYIKVNDSTYMFNLDQFISDLKSIPYLSDKLIKNDSLLLAACNERMLKVVWESEPEGYFNIEQCDFLWSDRWVGGQGESITSYEVKDVVGNEGEIIVIGNLIAEGIKHVESEVKLVKKGNALKIDEISLNW